MYSYTYDEKTGGLLLNSTPTVFSKEPRPVYAPELDMLGFDKYWNYDKQDRVPYMWAESVNYWYRGKLVARLKGGDLYHAPEIIISLDEDGNQVTPEVDGQPLKPIDIEGMIEANRELLDIIEGTTVKKIVAKYEKYKNKLDVFHVAFSGGKDSTVLLDLVKKALPKKSFIVIFGDTGMEFPDTYRVVEETKKMCEEEEIPFYISKSKYLPEESWRIFGPPARVLRWCCSVHKSTPQTYKMREIIGKNNYIGGDFVGVRAHESVARSKYEDESFGKKQKGQHSFNSILEWTSAEVWLYIFARSLIINQAYKKGNSRAGCLLCPMGGGRGDYIQRCSYPDEVQPYIDMIMEMNARDQGDEAALRSYVCNGGWNARKNGRDLTISEQHYSDKIRDGEIVITVTQPKTDWREWIKTIGVVPFEYRIIKNENGYQVVCDASASKNYPKDLKRFKQVFHKAAHCVECGVCATNCRNGCISFDGGLEISNCIGCGQCHEIDDGCLAFHSLRTSLGGGKMGKKESLNSFANHAPKLDWVRDFFEWKEDFWELNSLNKKNQMPLFLRFLRESGLIDEEKKYTDIFYFADKYGWDSNTLWGIIISNFAYNPQFKWYIKTMDIGQFYERDQIKDLLNAEDVSDGDASSIIGAFKKFCELPMGTVVNWGCVLENGKKIDSLCRTKCFISDNRVILYSLYVFAEKCNDYREFTLAWLMNDSIDRDGISPSRIFGLDYEEMKSILLGLSARYPDFIDATFTNDLDKITIKNKTSQDVLALFKEEM